MNLVFYFAKLQKKFDNNTYLRNFFRNLFVLPYMTAFQYIIIIH